MYHAHTHSAVSSDPSVTTYLKSNAWLVLIEKPSSQCRAMFVVYVIQKHNEELMNADTAESLHLR